MTLKPGESENDTVVIKLPGLEKKIQNWESYSLNQNFLKPTQEWSFTVSDEDPTYNEILVPGAKVEISINDKIQCVGFIDKKTIGENSSSGTSIQIQGRDIMASVIESTVNPHFKFSVQSSLLKFIQNILDQSPLGTELQANKIYNSDDINFNIMTGTKRVPDPDAEDLDGKLVKKLKAHYGQGNFAFLDQILKRYGFMIWAVADGTGVIVAKHNFDNPPIFNLKVAKNQNEAGQNNLMYATKVYDNTRQPTVIIASGRGGGQDSDYIAPCIVMVNELYGLDLGGNLLPSVRNIIAEYKKQSAKILPIRPKLISTRKSFASKTIAGPLYLKDDEAQDLAQLEKFTIREMAERQQQAIQLSGTVQNHTQNGIPWTTNTSVNIYDEVNDTNEVYWILDKTFTKSYSGGTATNLKLIKPYTMIIG